MKLFYLSSILILSSIYLLLIFGALMILLYCCTKGGNMILFYMIYLQDQFEQLQKVFFVLLVKLKVFRVLSNILAKF